MWIIIEEFQSRRAAKDIEWTQSHKKLRAYPRRKGDKNVQHFILEAFNSNLFSSALFS